MPQPCRIAAKGQGHVSRDVVGGLETFLMGAQRERAHDAVDHRAQIEVDAIEIELAGFDSWRDPGCR